MEKFSFLKFVKISFLVLGLSSFIFTSCKSDDDDPKNQNNFTDIDVDGQVLNLDDIHIVYPKGHTFGAWKQKPVKIKNFNFDYFLTMDTLSQNVRIHYYLLSDPSTANQSDVDVIADAFKNDTYSEDAGHELLSDETVSFAGHDSRKLTANQFAYLDKTTYKLVKLDTTIYKERYVFYDNDTKKLFTVSMEIPEPFKASRRTELYGIISSIKVNK